MNMQYVRWSAVQGDEGHQLRRTSIQLFGIFLDARIDFMKKGDRVENVIAYVQVCLENEFTSSSNYTNVLNGKAWKMTCFVCRRWKSSVKIAPPPVGAKRRQLVEKFNPMSSSSASMDKIDFFTNHSFTIFKRNCRSIYIIY